MKRIYQVWFDSDGGELWLDENLVPLRHVDANDANFREEYHGFIFAALNAEMIRIDIRPSDKMMEKLWDNAGDKDGIFKLFEKEIRKEAKKHGRNP